MKKYQPKLPLWPHQQKALAKMRNKESFALFLAMRAGKTPTLLADFGQLELDGKAKDLLVMAPAGVYKTWVEAMRDHLSDDLKSRLLVHVWQSGSGKGLERDRKAFLAAQDSPRALLLNVEAISRPGDARTFCTAFLGQRDNVVAADESTVLKNPSAKRTKFIIKSIKPLATYRRILSGLPTPRSPLDLFSQMEFLDWQILGFRSWYAFRAHVAFMKIAWFGGRSVQLIDKDQGNNGYRPEAVAELQKLIAPHSFRVEFRPKVPSTYSIWEVELTKEQRKAYQEIKEFATTMLSNEAHITATVVIAQIMRMHQVLLGHVRDEEGKEHLIPENRTAALLELLEDVDCDVVIWFTYIIDLERVMAAIEDEYGPGSTAKFYGGNVDTREADEKRFKSDSKCRFMGATAGAGGRGRTWPNADLVVYFSSSDDLEKREQSEQRAHARNKEIGVDYVDLIVRGTIEEKILEALRKKINMAASINADSWRDWVI